MNYYLAGIDAARGDAADDVSAERPYYELGWEITTTHFDVKHRKALGAIDSTRDTIVTCSGREFLYSAEFDRVIDYRSFLSRDAGPDDRVVSLMDRYAGGTLPADYFDRPHGPDARYRWLESDRRLITNLDVRAATLSPPRRPYCCFVIRRRSHGSYRNFDESLAWTILSRLCANYSRVFIVGRDIEQFAADPRVGHVDLPTFTRLIQDARCRLIVGSLTGPMHLAALVSRARVCLVLNHDSYDIPRENHPVLMGRCVTYSRSRFLFVAPEGMDYLLERYDL